MNCFYCKRDVPDGLFCNLCGWDQRKAAEPELAVLYNQWKNHHFRKLGDNGKNSYIYAWKYLKPYENRRISTLTLEDLQEIFDSQSQRSKSHQEKIRVLINQLYQFAILFGYVKVNLAPYLILTGYNKNDYTPLTLEEIETLFKHSKRTDEIGRTVRIILILVFTGWRPDELFAIKKESVNLEKRYFISGSKTEAGKNRIVPIARCILPFVEDLYNKTRQDDYLIKSPLGKKVVLNNWRKRNFYPCMRVLGINKPDDPHRIKPYSMRHTFATLAYQADVKPDLLIKMIGHTKFKFTSKVYIHNSLNEYSREVEKISALFDE